MVSADNRRVMHRAPYRSFRCHFRRVENGHTVPSLETLAKIAEAMEITLADFFPGTETPRDRDTQKMLGELSEDEIRFLSEIKRYSTTLSNPNTRLRWP